MVRPFPTEVVAGLPIRRARAPRAVVAGLTARRAARSGGLWGYVFGIFVASSALGYAATYKTRTERDHLAATFGTNAAIEALIGPAHQIQTVAGFTAWRSLGVLSIVGAVWGLLAGTRLLRGEEEAGRWEVLLVGHTTRKGAARQALVGLAAGAATLWTVTALVTAVVGRSSKVDIGLGSALYLALALVASAVMFLAVGALASQLSATRRQAATYAGAVLGLSYALRLLADSRAGLGWLRWATPLGWVEMLRPVVSANPLPLIPIFGLILVLVGLTVSLASARDLGASVLPDRSSASAHTRLLSGPLGLAVRLGRPTIAGWMVAIGAFALLIGFIAKAAGNVITSSSSAEKAISRLGAVGVGPDVFLGVTFLMVALLVSLIGAGQVVETRTEEARGQLDNLLVRPVARWRWLAGRLGVASAVLVAAGLLAGVSSWLGQASQHSGVPVATLLGAGCNVVPPAICVLGIGFLALGLWPRSTSTVSYGVLAWSFLVDLVGGLAGLNHWLLDTSLFHQMAAAPAQSPNWTTSGVMVAVGVAAGACGVLAFTHRDLQGE
jgi:ABC-2 type transport system permease protein